jgi:hypothetical protein
MVDTDIRCRCMGIDRRTRCENDATQEDGLCATCRCPHGCCADHGEDPDPHLFFEDPVGWMEWFQIAARVWEICRMSRVYEKQKEAEQDELRYEPDIQDEEGTS